MPSINDSLILNENTSITRINSGVQVFIDGILLTTSIIRNSISIENILTRQVDTSKFTIRKYGDSHTFIPTIGNEIEIYNDGTKIFGGLITKITQRAEDYKIILFDIECEDYTRLLNRKLVADSYSNQNIGDIISSINTNYLSGFTTNNVKGTSKVISYIAFNYSSVSQALTQLADLINYDWYVDYNKDIHFFSKTEKVAPIDIQDNDGSFIFKSLRIRRDNSQVKNRIFVRGGEYLADTFTTEFISDGIQNVYNLPYKYEDLQVSVTGEIWNGGIDEVNPISQFDYVWNKDEKFIRFRGDRVPSSTSNIDISGQPFLPVRVVLEDEAAINSMISAEGGDGIYEYLIIDKSINSRGGARERASAELESYKQTLSEGQFTTYTDGLQAGQRIRINSSAHGIDEYFIINKVRATMYTHEALQYEVSLVTTKTLGIIEFLQSLLVKETKQIVINENEIVDLVYAKSEISTISEMITSSKVHNPVTETLTANEVVTEQDLNYLTEFVLGPYTPNNTKRVFILNQSFLGPIYVTNRYDIILLSESITISIV